MNLEIFWGLYSAEREITFCSCNIEDAWQGMKVWSCHMNGGRYSSKSPFLWENGKKQYDRQGEEWVEEWKKWSQHIRFSGEAKRHRMKIDSAQENPNVPLFSYYRGKRYGYTKARKLMYIRWYAKLAKETKAFAYLQERYRAGIPLILLDPDGQPRDEEAVLISLRNEGKYHSMQQRVNDPKKIFGHGFVLACLLAGIDVWSNEPF